MGFGVTAREPTTTKKEKIFDPFFQLSILHRALFTLDSCYTGQGHMKTLKDYVRASMDGNVMIALKYHCWGNCACTRRVNGVFEHGRKSKTKVRKRAKRKRSKQYEKKISNKEKTTQNNRKIPAVALAKKK